MAGTRVTQSVRIAEASATQSVHRLATGCTTEGSEFESP
jgi:hypothetical protein